MAPRAAPKSTAAMCVLTIGYMEVLLPANAGIKVVELLRGAVRCETHFDVGPGRCYVPGEEIDVEYAAVKAGQVRPRKSEDSSTTPFLQLGHEPLKLPRP